MDRAIRPNLLLIREAAEILRCSCSTVRRLIAQGKLRAYRVGGGVRVDAESLQALPRVVA